MPGIYVTSKVAHASKWLEFRESGVPIISTWIDTVNPDGAMFHDLWHRCFDECRRCDVLVAYVEEGEVLKGGIAEIGAALACGHPVFIVGDSPTLGTLNRYREVKRYRSIQAAIQEAMKYCGSVERSHPDGSATSR